MEATLPFHIENGATANICKIRRLEKKMQTMGLDGDALWRRQRGTAKSSGRVSTWLAELASNRLEKQEILKEGT